MLPVVTGQMLLAVPASLRLLSVIVLVEITGSEGDGNWSMVDVTKVVVDDD